MKRIFIVLLGVLLSQVSIAEDHCDVWFANAKIKTDQDCLLSCATIKTDLGTFDCPDRCAELCKSPSSVDWVFQLSDLYPGLTKSERALAASSPVKTLSAYKLSWKAEKLCLQLYRNSQTNDESDACRHFVWASVMRRELGADFGNQVLNAHEDDDKEPTQERSMDLANNRQGMISEEQLERSHKTSDDDILNSFKDNLKQKRLIILKSKPSNWRVQ